MSMPFSIIVCNRCKASWQSTRLWGLFCYELDGGVIAYADRTLGWCDGCRQMQPIEVLPSNEDLQQRLQKAQQALATHEATMTEHELQGAPLTRWQRFVEGFLRPTALKEQRKRVEWHQRLQKDVVVAIAHLQWRDTRLSSPRCLHCSSTEVTPVGYTLDRQHPYDLALAHPHCGGVLTVHKSTVQLSSSRRELFYDPEGNRLTPIEQVIIPPRSDTDEYLELI